jgi:hypothetical protein
MLIRTKARSYKDDKPNGYIEVVFCLYDIKRIESKKIAKKLYSVIVFDDNECVEVMILFETLIKLWLGIRRGDIKVIDETGKMIND